MLLVALLGLVAHATASPSVVGPFRQRPPARLQAVKLRGGVGKEAPGRKATAPFAALVAAHGLVIASYGGGTLGLGTRSALIACAAVSLSDAYKPYMIGVHVALVVQGVTTVAYGAQSLIYNVLRLQGASAATNVPRFALMTALSAGALYAELQFKPKSAKTEPRIA